jgi:hypothetical protein
MKHRILSILSGLVVGVVLVGHATVPVTGRKSLALLPADAVYRCDLRYEDNLYDIRLIGSFIRSVADNAIDTNNQKLHATNGNLSTEWDHHNYTGELYIYLDSSNQWFKISGYKG